MGNGRGSLQEFSEYAKRTTLNADGSRRTYRDIFQQRTIHDDLNPKNISVRESCDSEDNPNSTPIYFALDVTGSMGFMAGEFANNIIPELMGKIYDEVPIVDPHVGFMAVGDVNSDRAPLQVSQMEADIRIAQGLPQLYLEGNGGSNDSESYHLPWYFVATRTKIDSFIKRNKKGYLFTIGDEMVPPTLTKSQIEKVFGVSDQQDYTAQELFDMASEQWHIFHIIIEQGNFARRRLKNVVNSWYNLLGRRALRLNDYTKTTDLIMAALKLSEGATLEDVINDAPENSRESLVKAFTKANEFVDQAT